MCRCLRSLALGLLDVLADCAQCHIVLLGDLRVSQSAVEVVGHQLLDASPPEPHQEAALLEVCPLLGRPASSHRRLQCASSRHQRVTVSGVSLQDLRLHAAISTKTHQGFLSQVSVVAFSLPVSSAAIECNLMILQIESQSCIVLMLRVAISAMTSMSIPREMGSSLGLSVVTMP